MFIESNFSLDHINTNLRNDMEHCMAKHGYSEREQNMTCCYCGKPLSGNRRVNQLYTAHTAALSAKGQLGVLADMLADKKQPMSVETAHWFGEEIRKFKDKIIAIKD